MDKRPERLVFVTGTGTEVGKTWVGARLAEVLRKSRRNVAARKPAQSFALDEGRPTDAQVARIDSLKKDLNDVANEFDAFVAKEIPAVNKSLTQKKLQKIQPVDRKTWDATESESGPSTPGAARFFRERD